MNIFSQEIKMSALSMIYWTAALILLMMMFMLMYPALSQDISVFESLLNNFPLELRQALGITSLNLTHILGYYGFLFVYILLVGSVYAMKSAMSVLSEETRSKTADFLLSKPVSRTTIVTAKILSVITNLVVQNIIFAGVSYIIMLAYGRSEFDGSTLALINLSLIQVQLFFFAVGVFLAAVTKKLKTVLPVSLGVVFGFYIVQMINQSINDPKLAYVTPFGYFEVGKIIENENYDMKFLFLNLIIVAALTGLTYILYQRKDMPSI